jgi:FkbM family methyltransferase
MPNTSRRLKNALRHFFSTRLKDHEIRTGLLNGAKIHTSWHDYPGAILGTTERNLLRWLAANVQPGETWLDVGANCGYTAIALSRLVGESGRVFAFEPVVSTAGCLSRTRELNGLDQMTVVPLALGSLPDIQTLRVPATRGMADYTLEGASLSETIYAISLDALWPALGGADSVVHGIKIDVQGMELQVIAGMRELLARWAPKLIVEFHRGVNRGEALELLASAGYSMDFEPVERDDAGNALAGTLANDASYVFRGEAACVSSYTR